MRESKFIQRLRSETGESIAEVLVSLLISTVALTMLAGMIMTASGIVKRSSIVVKDYVEQGNNLAQQGGASSGSGIAELKTRELGPAGTMSLKKLTDDEENQAVSVDFYTNDRITNSAVTAYKVH